MVQLEFYQKPTPRAIVGYFLTIPTRTLNSTGRSPDPLRAERRTPKLGSNPSNSPQILTGSATERLALTKPFLNLREPIPPLIQRGRSPSVALNVATPKNERDSRSSPGIPVPADPPSPEIS